MNIARENQEAFGRIDALSSHKTLPNTACTGQVGFAAIFKQFSSFEFILLSGRVYAHPPASNADR
jgi:hypothetical protein